MLLFFNLALLQTELNALRKETKNKQMVENFTKLFAGMNEEEKGTNKTSTEFSLVDLFFSHHHEVFSLDYRIILTDYLVHNDNRTLPGNYTTLIQPPEC